MMYMREARGEVPVTPVPAAAGVAITVCVLMTLYLGVLPSGVLNFTDRSARQFINGSAVRAVLPAPLPSGQ
jgi:NADH:ubiquinone oxidoreductase subunit 2 (subunit N)